MRVNIVEFRKYNEMLPLRLLLSNEITRSFVIIELSNRISPFTIDLYRGLFGKLLINIVLY